MKNEPFWFFKNKKKTTIPDSINGKRKLYKELKLIDKIINYFQCQLVVSSGSNDLLKFKNEFSDNYEYDPVDDEISLIREQIEKRKKSYSA